MKVPPEREICGDVRPQDRRGGKKPYERPELRVEGTLEEMTRSLVLGASDGITGTQPLSDRALKEGFALIDPRDVFTRLASLPIETWSYCGQAPVRHMGPMAQDFARAFGLGDSDKRIHVVDAIGVAFAAIQGLHGIVAEKDEEIKALRAEIAELKKLAQDRS